MSLLAALTVALFSNAGDRATPPSDQPLNVPPPASRFENASPLPSLPAVHLDVTGDGWGLAQQTARSKSLQARVLWIDGTANIERYNTEPQVVDLMRKIRDSGFNTVVFDVKPISGQVLYPSHIAPKLTEWKGHTLPQDYDALKLMVREAHANRLSLLVSLNAFSEGHRDFKIGPGYARPDWQTVLYEPSFSVATGLGEHYPASPLINKMPVDDKAIGTFNDRRSLPTANDSFYAVTINRHGMVIEALSGQALGTVAVPPSGSVLVGSGVAGLFLRTNATPGVRLTFDSLPQFVPISERPEQQIPLMVNPNNPEVQDYELSIAREILTNYDVDGIMYDDRLRYAGINADFSTLTQAAFEGYVKRRVSWPDDVFKFTMSSSLNRGLAPGPYYDAWITWRAQVLRNYIFRVRQLIKQVRPAAQLGLYVGSWYGEYPRIGANYGSPDLDAGFWFLTPEYQMTGMASLLDVLITGCYYPTGTIYEAMEQGIGIGFSVESAGQLSNRVVRDQSWVYAGLSLDQYNGNPEGLAHALQASCGSTQGVMVFDLSHNIEPLWPLFKLAFADPREPPHGSKGTLDEVRKRRAAVDRLGKKDTPVPINSGGAGTGM